VSTFVVVRSRVLPAKVFPSQNLKFGFFLTPVEIEIQNFVMEFVLARAI
jgi:hypothetical protein